jgi:DNA-binding ferritin-like protein
MHHKQQEDQAAIVEALAARIEADGENPKQCADELAKKLTIPEKGENLEKTRNTVVSFVYSYKRKAPEISNVQWLDTEREQV